MRIRHPTLHLCLFLLLVVLELTQGEWTPRSRFWKHIQASQSGLTTWWYVDDEENQWEEGDQYDNIRTCLDDNLPEETARQLTSSSSIATVVNMLNDTDGTTFMVEIQSALSPHEAVAVKALAACTREFIPNFFEHREFQTGGNDVTFLNIVLQLFLPQVAATVQKTAELAFDHAKWHTNYSPPGTLGLRTTEYLSYRDFKHLGEHGDSGSIYTVLFALSHPDSYQGGEFYIKDSSEHYHYHKPMQYSAVVFLSEISHGVTDIESGHREMFTNELWKYDDPPWPQVRPTNEYMELFLERCGEMDTDDVEWPSLEDVEQWLADNGREGLQDEQYGADPQANDEFEDENDEFEDESDEEL
jgi:hypothetical protein